MRYVDYGNTETIKKETLVELPPSLADARPFAQLYHLGDCAVSSGPGANEMTIALVRYSFSIWRENVALYKHRKEGKSHGSIAEKDAPGSVNSLGLHK